MCESCEQSNKLGLQNIFGVKKTSGCIFQYEKKMDSALFSLILNSQISQMEQSKFSSI